MSDLIPMRPIRLFARRGAALPMVILITVLLTLSLTAAFTLNSSELRIVDNQQEQLEAFAIAESGRERYLSDRASFGFNGEPAASESVRVVLTNGYADVVVTRMRASAGNAPGLYALRARGTRTVARQPGVPAAVRTVGQFLMWQTGTMNIHAAWTSLSGLHKNGGSGTLSGIDGCGAMPNVSGVAVPTAPGYTQNGGSSVPTGGPPPIKILGPQPASDDSVKIDWNGIVNGNAITPTITIPGQAWPSFADPNYWPIIKVNGDFTLPGDGRGMLIVTGTMTISGSRSWDGVLMVGGNLTSNGNNTVQGAVVSGLNRKLGAVVPQGDVGNGNKTYRFNSCNVSRALSNFGGLVPYQNAWVDNWASY
jgi:Tfp pilus assembly protein PilX